MFIDLLSTDNVGNYNIKLAHLMGLNAAVYIATIINIFNKAQRKNQLIEGTFFKVDRAYITEKTTLTEEEQIEAENSFVDIAVLTRYPRDKNIIHLDIRMLASIITDDDVQVLSNIEQLAKIKKKPKRDSKRQHIIEELKNSIECFNDELKQAYCDWVDGVYSNPTGFLSKKSIVLFQQTLNDFTKGDLDLALKVLDIATIHGQRDCQWAINTYNKNKQDSLQYATPQVKTDIVNVPKDGKLTGDTF